MWGGARGSSQKSAPSRPNSAHPEVNGPEGADWPSAPEPSRHTTGRGCWHPPVKRFLLFSLFSFSANFFTLSLIPLFQQEVIGIGKKNRVKMEEVVAGGGARALFSKSRGAPAKRAKKRKKDSCKSSEFQ